MQKKKTKSLVLLSGGMDSGVCLANEVAKEDTIVEGLIINYGQSHEVETDYAKQLADYYDVPVMELNLYEIFKEMSSYLTGKAEANTYVPARNFVFISIATAVAEDKGFDQVIIGAHKEDAGGYPDTTESFIKEVGKASQEGTKNKIKITAPFVEVTKDKIVKRGSQLEFPFEKTITCYNGQNPPCQKCNSCKLRAEAFENANVKDPLIGGEDINVKN